MLIAQVEQIADQNNKETEDVYCIVSRNVNVPNKFKIN